MNFAETVQKTLTLALSREYTGEGTKRRVAFVTGTRAEFGLMEHALRRLRDHPRLNLSIVATGMHLSREHGYTLNDIKQHGWTVNATVPWRGPQAEATGTAIAGLAKAFAKLRPDVVLVVGDRVEAFAAATAGHLSGAIVAHVHGGDRALGQSDDALRHAITKLSHLHFPATAKSAQRIRRLGEDGFRIHLAGTPGLDGVVKPAAASGEPFVLAALHPDDADEAKQRNQAALLMKSLKAAGVPRGVIVWPNNDPGWRGIATQWKDLNDPAWTVHANLPRDAFLELLGTCVCLIGNSSSGILEAASLGTRVINVGNRQLGRERSANVVDVPWQAKALTAALANAWNHGRRVPYRGLNVYGAGDAGKRIANVLATVPLDDRLRKKLICY